MARRRRAEKRVPPEDIKYGSVELSQFINRVMQRFLRIIAKPAIEYIEKRLLLRSLCTVH